MGPLYWTPKVMSPQDLRNSSEQPLTGKPRIDPPLGDCVPVSPVFVLTLTSYNSSKLHVVTLTWGAPKTETLTWGAPKTEIFSHQT